MHPHRMGVAVALFWLACAPARADVFYKTIVPGEQDMLAEEKLRAADPEVQRASLLFDFAERELAVARRPLWAQPDPGRLIVPRMTRADTDRIDFYKRKFIAARRVLLAVLQEKRSAAAEHLTASLDSPIARP